MGCIPRINQKSIINVITSNKTNPKLNEKKDLNEENNILIYKEKKNEDFIRQTSISKKVQYLIDNNPLPFVKIKRKKNH